MIIEGENIILKGTFRDDTGTLTNPTLPVTVSVKDPAGATTEAEATQVSTGLFEYIYLIPAAGTYYYKFETNDISIEQSTFTAEPDKTK